MKPTVKPPVPPPAKRSVPPELELFALAFGALLGLAIWKFGNPVILDHQIGMPSTPQQYLSDPWPIHWAGWVLVPFAVIGALLARKNSANWPRPAALWLLPLAWLGWEFISATATVDAPLTEATLWEFAGCVACYFLGARLFARGQLWRWLLPGLFAGLIYCSVRAINQHVIEFPQTHQALVEGQANGWTNFPPESLQEMQSENLIMVTNGGALVANPVILAKFAKGRVSGTLVYPNALAQILLLCLPLAFTLAFGATKTLKPRIRVAAIAMTVFLGGAAFLWTGSKLGWLLALGVAGLCLLRRDWSKKLKFATVTLVLVLGLGVFAVRFHNYLAAGATSVSARFDYWRAAVQTTESHPLTGTGPGTFQRPYAQLKSPAAEMARLTHNDYLEQFCDSGLPGGGAYTAWILLALYVAWKKTRAGGDAVWFAIFAGLIAWYAQGFGEFGLYIPALAWPAFTLLGCLVGKEKLEERT